MSALLPIILLVPLIGAIVGAFMRDARLARGWALLVSLISLVLTIWLGFDLGTSYQKLIEFKPESGGLLALGSLGTGFHLGVTWVPYVLLLLTALLMPLALMSSFRSVTQRQTEYYAWMQALAVAMMGVFLARDLLLFYVFFELTLIPMFFIIGIWGGPDRRHAAGKFFLFTFAGSVFALAATVFVGIKAGSFDFAVAIPFAQTLPDAQRWWLFLGLLAGFAVKVPLFPVHTWLPLAHTEAPTAGSVILAGVLLKLGTYGVMALAVPIGLVGLRADWAGPLVRVIGMLCVIGIIYGALVAWVQQDIKKLVAYSSVSHLGFCVLGLIALNDIGQQGAVLYMINHGLNTGALFLVIGMIYDRYHTRDINALSGLARRMPKMAFFFVLFVLASIGLPGLNGFWNEFLTIGSAFWSPLLGIKFGVLAATGIVLGAIYMLHMTARVIWGPLKTPAAHADEPAHGEHGDPAHAHGHDTHVHVDTPGDLTSREMTILIPLAILAVVLGVKPGLITDPMLPPPAPANVVQLKAAAAPAVAIAAPVPNNQN